MILEAEKLSFSYGSANVLSEVDLTLRPGITAIIGPNAAGKSTLLKCLCGLLKAGGRVTLDGLEMHTLSNEQLASHVGYLPQKFSPRAVLTVFETVLLGRVHRLGWRVSPEDIRAVQQVLDDMDLHPIAGQTINQLSGGQAQRVAIAQTLAREPAVLLMDEPTSDLDLRRQFEVCSSIRTLTDSRHMTTAIALHDLNMAAQYADTVYVLQEGRVRCCGAPKEILTEEMIAAVYQVEAQTAVGEDGRLRITVLGPAHGQRPSLDRRTEHVPDRAELN